MVAHFSSRTVVERVFELAAKTGSLIFWPSLETNMAVTSRDILDHLPDDLTEGGKHVANVQSAGELI